MVDRKERYTNQGKPRFSSRVMAGALPSLTIAEIQASKRGIESVQSGAEISAVQRMSDSLRTRRDMGRSENGERREERERRENICTTKYWSVVLF